MGVCVGIENYSSSSFLIIKKSKSNKKRRVTFECAQNNKEKSNSVVRK